MTTVTVTIDRLGAQGDGIAKIGGRPVYVPYTLPGETVTIEANKDRGRLLSIEQPLPSRSAPACRYFGPQGERCGGCAMQHVATEDYQSWKRSRVVEALASSGIEHVVGDLVPCRPGSRRRAVLAARRVGKEFLLGFNQPGSHIIVSIDHCPVLSQPLEDRLNQLKALGRAVAIQNRAFRLNVLATASGVDVAILDLDLPEKQRQSAIDLAIRDGFARLSLGDEILVEARKPVLDFAGIAVVPPPGGFVQASESAENTMADLILQHFDGASKCADLFAGCGAFALRLARQSAVHAVESEPRALQALDSAARHHAGLKPVTTERRDLFRSPLQPSDLKSFDCVVFDPPRAGAEAQATALATSTVSRVAAVSCNPNTLARDVRILIDGGFKLRSVTPIDQFLWSPHVEAVALLERG